MKRAWLCPGQGSQYRGMGRGFFFENVPAVRRIFIEAEEISGLPLRDISRDGEDAALRDPGVLEPLLTAFALSYMQRLRERGEAPAAIAGYSAGELAALCGSGALTQTQALEIATMRGSILQGVAARIGGGMIALLHLERERAEALVREAARRHCVAIGGCNAPDHVTVVGDLAGLAAIQHEALQLGAQVYAIPVAAAWHCALAEPAARRVAMMLERYAFRTPRIAFYSSVTARRESDSEVLRHNLADQVQRPVLWQATVRAIADTGVHEFYEVGAGRSLRGITQRIPLAGLASGRAAFRSYFDADGVATHPSRQEALHV